MIKSYKPEEIEVKSFEIIERELKSPLDPLKAPIIKRVIHTSADFEYAETLCFSKDAVESAILAIKNGCDILSDTTMVKAGVSKPTLKKSGGEIHCFIADEDVAARALEEGITRSAISMRKASETLEKPLIIAIGNAPTALIELHKLILDNKIKPALIIGVPVGFVNVVESKELIMSLDTPYIVAKGRKGGSNIAASIVNALLYMAYPR